MSRKRRMFNIDMPDEPEAPQEVLPGEARRGPMASAVRENADSLRERAEAEKAIRDENDALAHEYVRMKGQGLVIQRVALDLVLTGKLTRDRREVDRDDLRELCDSIRAIGLSNPIQVERCGDKFELVQGLRRLSAFRLLDAETPDGTYAEIPAVVTEQGETLDTLYRRMVDENLIRSDISFAEMAALAQAYSDDPDTSASTVDEAVQSLYGSAGKQKRSYIRAFAKMLDLIGPRLEHPNAIPRALGLSLRKKLEDVPESRAELEASLSAHAGRKAEDELEVLRQFCEGGEEPTQPFPAGNSSAPKSKPRPARTTFQVQSRLGPIKCTASQGRLELRGDADFSALERKRLEDAVARFLQGLDQV
ncbi:ParB/RepB/Spo0J family partition protein [Meridianimarinicoccus aquatilis]|uniref:Replication protein n=1 Tax=Meridianimarinicoccus aquatilis TaxID=2552766 RepID=A0A4R6AM86_9RHOB|nr:ParB/RepB/Spo0J family partition protein [Fluviibacterium aquatile]TDL85451.1 replication protein [Fluviibacterium aquatile]